MHVLYLLSNLSYASDNERDGFPAHYTAWNGYIHFNFNLGSTIDQLVGEKKLVFHMLLCHLLLQTWPTWAPWKFLSLPQMFHSESMLKSNFWANVNQSWPYELIIMSPVVDLVAGLWLLSLILFPCPFCCQDKSWYIWNWFP